MSNVNEASDRGHAPDRHGSKNDYYGKAKQVETAPWPRNIADLDTETREMLIEKYSTQILSDEFVGCLGILHRSELVTGGFVRHFNQMFTSKSQPRSERLNTGQPFTYLDGSAVRYRTIPLRGNHPDIPASHMEVETFSNEPQYLALWLSKYFESSILRSIIANMFDLSTFPPDASILDVERQRRSWNRLKGPTLEDLDISHQQSQQVRAEDYGVKEMWELQNRIKARNQEIRTTEKQETHAGKAQNEALDDIRAELTDVRTKLRDALTREEETKERCTSLMDELADAIEKTKIERREFGRKLDISVKEKMAALAEAERLRKQLDTVLSDKATAIQPDQAVSFSGNSITTMNTVLLELKEDFAEYGQSIQEFRRRHARAKNNTIQAIESQADLHSKIESLVKAHSAFYAISQEKLDEIVAQQAASHLMLQRLSVETRAVERVSEIATEDGDVIVNRLLQTKRKLDALIEAEAKQSKN